jgi:ABC-type multidrug transport system fused ATPase/permease subunit
MMGPLVLAKIMNLIQEIVAKQQVIDSNILIKLSFMLLLIPAISLTMWIFHGPARVMEGKNAFLVSANYRKFLLAGTMAFPMEWHVEHHTGDTANKIDKGETAIFGFTENSFQIISMIVNLIGSCVALAYFHLPSVYIILFVIFIAGYIVIRYDKVLIPQYEFLNKAENKISEKVIDAITNIATIIILRVEKQVQKAISKSIAMPFSVYKSSCKTKEIKWFLVSLCSSIGVVFVLFSYLYGNYRDHTVIMFGTLYALYSYVTWINSILFNFAGKYGDTVRQKASMANAEKIANDFQAQEKVRSLVLNDNWNKLEIKSLSFSYHGEEGADLHLDDVSLDVEKGRRIALIGETGSGKSTLLKIIRELYSPSSLKLYLDDKPLKNGFKSISSEVALIPQDPEIFQETIMDNITVGADYDMAEILKYTDMACFTGVAMGLPNKFDSMIKEKGVNLSGGEKQRLALARGLLASRDKAIVLLDEPTSSVDVITEEKIFKNIFETFTDKAIVCSLHGLHLLPLFDKIYFFENGKIIAEGKFDELLESSKEFQKIWEDFVSNRDKKN